MAIVTPWWRVSTTRYAILMGAEKSINVEYWLTQLITVSVQEKNTTVSLSVPFTSLPGKAEEISSLGAIFTITLVISGIGFFFSLLTSSLYIFSMKKKSLLPLTKYTATIASLLFLVGPAYFALDTPYKISMLDSITPQNIYTFEGKNIRGFWGGISTKSPPGLYLMMWGPAIGWFSAVAAFVLNGLTLFLLKSFEKSAAKP
jgi:hypothetical protein